MRGKSFFERSAISFKPQVIKCGGEHGFGNVALKILLPTMNYVCQTEEP